MHRAVMIATASLVLSVAARAAPDYRVSQVVPLGAPDHWDYVSFDSASHRVFVAHGDHTDVLDAGTGRILGRLTGLSGAHGQAVAADGTIWADSGKTAQVTGYDPHGFAPIVTLPAGTDADGMIVDPSGKLLVVMDGDGNAATLIDTATRRVQATVPLGGSPEFLVADGQGHLYANIASTREIVAIDIASGRVAARHAVPDCESPHGLAMDTAMRRLFASCENGRLLVLDADSGHVLQTLTIGHGTDAAAFDPVRKLVYSSNSDGTLSVFREASSGSLTPLGDVATPKGSRTLAVDPANGRVYLATADLAGIQPAAVNGRIHYSFKPDSVKLLFLDPAGR